MRVIAIRDANENEVNIYGYGEMVGKEIPEGMGFPNPKIVLDNGKIVWGYQCWWGEATRVEQEMIGDRKVNIVELEDEINE